MSSDWTDYFLLACGAVILLVCCAAIADSVFAGEPKTVRGRVIARAYTPPSTSIGYAAGGKDGGGPVVVSNPEQYTVVVEYEGRTKRMRVRAQEYGALPEGAAVNVTYRTAWLSKGPVQVRVEAIP